MILRKANAYISLATTILLLYHAGFCSVWMLSRCKIENPKTPISIILVALMVVHAVLSIIMAFLGHKGAEKRKCNEYPKLNVSTYVQRISGIMMLLLLGFHIAGAANYYRPKILHAIVHPIFFMVALAHVSVSASKAFITLGIGNAKAIKILDMFMKIICLIIFVAGFVGFYICLFAGVAK